MHFFESGRSTKKEMDLNQTVICINVHSDGPRLMNDVMHGLYADLDGREWFATNVIN